MIAANRCAARFLNEHDATGPFVVHDGFRRDRIKDRDKFIAMYAGELADLDPDSLEGYNRLLRHLSEHSSELPLRSMVNRLLTKARLSARSGLHMGMALPAYTNYTSPLRKYVDFLVHLQIKSLLHGEPARHCSQPELDRLQQRLRLQRQAIVEAERWLAMIYLEEQQKAAPGPWPATVARVENTGFTVRLDANGLEGYVDLKKEKEKFSYDKWTATLSSKTRRFRIGAPVQVTLAGSDAGTPHLALFQLDPASGLKQPKEPAESAKPVEPSEPGQETDS